MKMIFVALVAISVFFTTFVSCASNTQPHDQVMVDNWSIKPQLPIVTDNKTIPAVQNSVITQNSTQVDRVEAAQESQVLLLRIDFSSSPNLYGKYDLDTVSRDIWVMNADGSKAVNLTKGSANAMSADWSPDKSKIVFDSVDSYLQGSPICRISTMNANGSNVKRISPGASSRHFPAWSPDGSKIANSWYFVGKGTPEDLTDKTFELFTFNPDGAEDGHVKFSRYTGLQLLPRWFPDSRRIAYLDSETGNFEIYSGDIITGDTSKYNIESNSNGHNNYMPWFSLSPDATKIVYSHDLSRDYWLSGRELFLFDVNSGQSIQLTRNEYADDNPCFSPDGKKIVFASFGDTKENSGMFIMDIDGTSLKQISSQYGDMPMKWR